MYKTERFVAPPKKVEEAPGGQQVERWLRNQTSYGRLWLQGTVIALEYFNRLALADTQSCSVSHTGKRSAVEQFNKNVKPVRAEDKDTAPMGLIS